MKWFRVPKDLVSGKGSLSYLSTLKGKKAVLVTGGSSMKKYGFLDEAERQLKKAGMSTYIIDGVEPNPSVETVKRGAQEMLKFKPDWIVSIGGGSALDAAKIMWVFYEYPDLEFEDIIEPNTIPVLRDKAKFIAIPSTSGTASEITAFSVITDTKKHIKYPIVSYEITPDIGILDPDLPAKMPPHITANTGMDVMAHAVEAFVSTNASSFTDPLALEAIKIVLNQLPVAYKDGSNIKAREDMHEASAIAGMAFTNASLGIVHSMAHKIGGEFGLTHGLANAILMPYIIEYNKQGTEKFKYLESQLGINNFENTIRDLNKQLDIPLNLKEVTEVEITEDKFLNVLENMSNNAFLDPCTLSNPMKTNPEDIKQIYKAAYYGK